MTSHSDRADAQAIITELRDKYVADGSVHGPLCTSKTCLNLATTRVFWPVRPDEAYPVYCTLCAAWAKRVLETLGTAYREELLPRPPGKAGKTRLIDMES